MMNKLKGIGANQGTIKGKAVIILTPNEISKIESGDILVTETTNPLFTSAILKAKALVTDLGGALSHRAIVARELNIPCVVGTGKATKVLKDGQDIIVDGKEGVIYYE